MKEDSFFVKKAKEGDGEAYGELVRRYEKFVYNTAYGITLNSFDAFDASQNAFIKGWRAINTFKEESSFSTWLYRIVSNCAKDIVFERQKRKADLPAEEVAGLSGGITPEDEYIKNEEGELLKKAILSLDSDSREIIVMRELSELSYAEIAEALEIEIGTVKSRLNRARTKLREKILEQKGKTVCQKEEKGGVR